MRSKLVTIIAYFIVISASPVFAADDAGVPKFSDYPSVVYTGRLHIPSYYVKSDGIWRDDMGKAVSPPRVNFAGKYYIGLHSCGTECRYYTLSDLDTGNDSKALDMFSSDGAEPTKTSDGRTYVTDLISRPDSRLVIAQYQIDETAGRPAECRERMFLLSDDGEKASPVTKTLNGCQLR
ncbi:hypothetical protein [Paraburkholderia tropica]|uniref:hypothetical protein n=1 Tax=Paraburkholderia tropica TaxID=92647 RepID=UPI001CC6FCFF|nr:hypothetical protein [Paraburkholderia tropica]